MRIQLSDIKPPKAEIVYPVGKSAQKEIRIAIMEKLHPKASAKGYKGNFFCIDAMRAGATRRTKTTKTPAS